MTVIKHTKDMKYISQLSTMYVFDRQWLAVISVVVIYAHRHSY